MFQNQVTTSFAIAKCPQMLPSATVPTSTYSSGLKSTIAGSGASGVWVRSGLLSATGSLLSTSENAFYLNKLSNKFELRSSLLLKRNTDVRKVIIHNF